MATVLATNYVQILPQHSGGGCCKSSKQYDKTRVPPELQGLVALDAWASVASKLNSYMDQRETGTRFGCVCCIGGIFFPVLCLAGLVCCCMAGCAGDPLPDINRVMRGAAVSTVVTIRGEEAFGLVVDLARLGGVPQGQMTMQQPQQVYVQPTMAPQPTQAQYVTYGQPPPQPQVQYAPAPATAAYAAQPNQPVMVQAVVMDPAGGAQQQAPGYMSPSQMQPGGAKPPPPPGAGSAAPGLAAETPPPAYSPT